MELKQKKGSWHSPKQLWIVIFAGILFFGATILVAGMTNTVFPIFGQLRNWDYSVLVMMSGVAMFVSAVTGILFGQLALKIGYGRTRTGSTLFFQPVEYRSARRTSCMTFLTFLKRKSFSGRSA